MSGVLPAHLARDGGLRAWVPLPAGLVSCGGRTGSPDRGLCLGFPSCPPSACTCDPDCSGLEARASLEKELSGGAAPRQTEGGRGASEVPRQARLRPGELSRGSCAAGETETGAGAGTCWALQLQESR